MTGLSRWPQLQPQDSQQQRQQDPEALELREQGELAASCRAAVGRRVGGICSRSQPQPSDRELQSKLQPFVCAHQGRPPSADDVP